jgi:TonB family protein
MKNQLSALRPFIVAGFAVLLIASVTLRAAGQSETNGGLSTAETDRIVRAFTNKEIQFRRALNQYSFKRDAVIQSIGMGGQVSGEYHRISNFTFDDSGNRYEKISYFPMSTMDAAGVTITTEDIDDLGGINPFALEPDKIDRYTFRYAGKEKIDELNLYVFDVAPKVMPDQKKKERLFLGRVWVDDKDLLIVKTRGKGVPETKQNKFPNVETYREQIDGRYWFPTYSYADEELVFDNGNSIHIRMKIRYTDFAPAREDENPGAGGGATPIEGGLLNSKALTLPQPKLSEEAKRQKQSGKITVRVIVDENGKVVSAVALNGPAVLREIAQEAARQATFAPTTQDGIVVRVRGELVYDIKN